MNAILVERNYKGELERFALTTEEFKEEYCVYSPVLARLSLETSGSFTLSPMVHIWYQPAEVGSDTWNRFFTDMTWGLSQGDLDNKNYAFIREDRMRSLKEFLPKAQEAAISEDEVYVLSGIVHSLRHELNGSFEPDAKLEKLLTVKEMQLEAARNGVRVTESALENCWAARDGLYNDIVAQLSSGQNQTAYGEPQAFMELSNGRCVEITQEQDMLPEGEQFYSARLYGAEREGTDNLPIYAAASKDLSADSLKALILDVLLNNEIEPMKAGRVLEVPSAHEGAMVVEADYAETIQKAYDALSEALEAVDLAENNGSRLHPSVGNRISTAKLILAEVVEDVRKFQEQLSEGKSPTSSYHVTDQKQDSKKPLACLIQSAFSRSSVSAGGPETPGIQENFNR